VGAMDPEYGEKILGATISKSPDSAFDNTQPIPIRDPGYDLPLRFAAGGAVPGDAIVGILEKGDGIAVYPVQSPALRDFEDVPERWVELRWDVDEEVPHRFPARIAVQSVNEAESLAQIYKIIADTDARIDNVRMARQSRDFVSLTIDVEVY